MSLKTLQLEKFHLMLASEKLRLDVESTVDVRFPSGWSPSLDNDEMIRILASGYFWVSRGRRCRADFRIFFEGTPLDSTSRIFVLESLGYYIRDAHLWHQLALSTSLKIPQSIQIAESAADISIYINHGIYSPKMPPKAWLLDNFDIKAPESVLCAEFECLQIRLDFHQILNRSGPAVKRVKSCLQDAVSPDMMLLDCSSGLEEDSYHKSFEQAVEGLPERLSNSIANIENSANSISLLGKRLLSLENKAFYQKISTKTAVLRNTQTGKLSGKRYPFPQETRDKLNAWANSHSRNLNPTKDEKIDLEKETRLQKNQVQTWFKNAKKKKKSLEVGTKINSTTVSTDVELAVTPFQEETYEESMILSQLDEEMLFDQDQDYPDEDEMLLTQTTATSPSLISESFITSVSTNHPTTSLKRPALDGITKSDPTPDEEMLFNRNLEYPEDKEMIPSQTTCTTPLLTSRSSTLSTLSTTSSTTTLKRSAADQVVEPNSTSSLTILSLMPSNKLTSLAIRTLIAGPSNRKRDLEGVTICKPPPSVSLSTLVPSMFSPGFKELMAHNSKFLPTISNAICVSWVRNVQGVGLRQKLNALSNSRVSEYCERGGDEGSAERLVRVVQGRLWITMQRVLYDERAAKKLWKKNDNPGAEKTTTNEKGYGYEDLLGENGGHEIHAEGKNAEDVISEEFMDDSEELLFEGLQGDNEDHDSDEGLLDYLDKQEKLTVEAETDEMLFGAGWEGIRLGEVDDEEREILLLGEVSQEENMLL